MFDELYKPMKITGENIDPRYFRDNGDGTYSATPLFIYSVGQDIIKFTKRKIYAMDDGTYTFTKVAPTNKETGEVGRKDPWAESAHKAEWHYKWGEKEKELNTKWYEYRDAHPDEFQDGGPMIDRGGEDETRFFAGYSPDCFDGLSLNEILKLFNAANELVKKYKDADASSEDALPKITKKVSKPEFKEAHDKLKEGWKKELGIPEDDWVCPLITDPSVVVNTRKIKGVGTDDSCYVSFTQGLIQHLTGMTAQDFFEREKEGKKTVKEDFVKVFNDVSQNLVAVKEQGVGLSEAIIIRTKCTDESSSIPLITIAQEDPKDRDFVYNLRATTDGERLTYTKSIVTKDDLKVAIDRTIMMLDMTVSLKKYIPDLESARDSI